MSTTTGIHGSRPATTAPFADVLCATDGSRGSADGVRQAIELASPDGHVSFVCVTDVRGVGANRVADVGEHRANLALAGAKALARDCGVRCATELVHGSSPAEEILARQDDHELLVVGSHPETRVSGIMTGRVATVLAHRTTGPLLVAKPPRSPVPFPQRIVVATDGTREDDLAVAVAMRIAAARDASVDVVHATHGPGIPERGAIGAMAALIWSRTDREPLVTEEKGDPADVIARVVARDEASLVVVGHGGRQGLRALGSVSEQVVHRAGASVLVVPTA